MPALRNLCTLLADWSGEYPDPAVAAAKAAVAADELDLWIKGMMMLNSESYFHSRSQKSKTENFDLKIQAECSKVNT